MPARGRIVTTEALDREDISSYQLMLVAADMTTSPLSTSIPLTVSVLDVNDNRPTFERPSWIFSLPENTNGTMIMDFNVSIASYDNY